MLAATRARRGQSGAGMIAQTSGTGAGAGMIAQTSGTGAGGAGLEHAFLDSARDQLKFHAAGGGPYAPPIPGRPRDWPSWQDARREEDERVKQKMLTEFRASLAEASAAFNKAAVNLGYVGKTMVVSSVATVRADLRRLKISGHFTDKEIEAALRENKGDITATMVALRAEHARLPVFGHAQGADENSGHRAALAATWDELAWGDSRRARAEPPSSGLGKQPADALLQTGADPAPVLSLPSWEAVAATGEVGDGGQATQDIQTAGIDVISWDDVKKIARDAGASAACLRLLDATRGPRAEPVGRAGFNINHLVGSPLVASERDRRTSAPKLDAEVRRLLEKFKARPAPTDIERGSLEVAQIRQLHYARITAASSNPGKVYPAHGNVMQPYAINEADKVRRRVCMLAKCRWALVGQCAAGVPCMSRCDRPNTPVQIGRRTSTWHGRNGRQKRSTATFN